MRLQVTLAGTEFCFGDVSIVAGGMRRRTNDLQQIGAFVCVTHQEGTMISRIEPALEQLTFLFFEALRGTQADAVKPSDFKRVKPVGWGRLGNCFTPCHEALCYYHVAA